MAYIYDLTDTWGNSLTAFDGIKLNVTDTASSAASKLLDLQINSSSKFVISKSGNVTASGIVQSTSGGFRFPDGTTQTTASVGGAGTVTSVSGTGTVSGLTLTGNVTTSGSLTLGGTLSLTSGNVTSALGYTPYNATNPAGYITSSALTPYLTSATAATTYQPLDGDLTAIAALAGTVGLIRKTAANTYSLDTDTYLTGITSGQVTTALGYTPYNATNPSGYLSTVSLTANVTGTLPIANGGTGATTAAGALTSLGAYPAANPSGYTSNTGTVTSVNLTAGTGVSVSGGPITSSGAITVTNTAPDQVVSLTAGSNVTVTGSYPNFTIAASGGSSSGGTVTSIDASGGTTGLTFSGGPITTSGTLTLGGTLDLDNGGTGATTASGARTALGLGTAATTDATAYATAAQGTKADTAVQTIASTDGSVTITGTTAIDLSVAVAGSTSNVLLPVRNTTGATLTKGTAVYISGATGQLSTVSKALATSDATSAQTLGLITANLANNSNGNVTLIGTITNIDTSAYTDGQQLYLSPTTAGTLTATKPHAPQHLVYMAVVEHAHPSQGKLFVKVQNGYEMDELHNVAAQSPANNDGLFYNTTTSLWEKKSIVTALGYTPYNATNPSGYTTNTGTVTSVGGTGTVSGLSLSGSVTTSGNLTLGGTLSLTSGNVTTALGYTPYDATNPSNYITSSALTPYLTSATAATTYQPLDGDLTAIAAISGTTGIVRKTAADTYTLDTNTYLTGITSGQVTTALGFTPYDAANPSGYITSSALSPYLTSATAATTYQPLDGDLTAIAALSGTSGIIRKTAADTYTLDTATYLTGITSGQVTTALGFTPYDATNPAGYTTNTGTVTGVSGTAPIVSSGGAAPAISITEATTSAAGSMSSADKTKLDGIATSANNYVLPKATATALGGVEVFDATVQTVAANAVSTTAARTYGVQLNAADQMVVNVPWVDTTNAGTVTSVGGTGTVNGITLTGTVTASGSLTLGGTLSGVNLTTQVTGTLPVANGGTGATTLTGYLKGSGTAALTASAAIPVADVTGAAPLASPTFTGTATFATTDALGPVRQNIVAVAALDIDCSAGNFFTKTIAANSTFTFSSVPATRAFAFTLELTHTSGTVTWPASVKWPGDTAPTLTTGKTHLFTFVTDDGGTRWRGVAQTNYVN
jgi:hypothetical protein